MMATTSVPAVWALSGLAIGMGVVFAYMLMFFLVLALFAWLITYFLRRVLAFLRAPGKLK